MTTPTKSTNEGAGLKLYVVGTSSANVDDWSIWDEFALVIASSPKQAEEMTDRVGAFEVIFDKPKVLVTESEPDWGDNL